MANQLHVTILQQGVETWNRWRREHPATEIDLSRADLCRASLSEANLADADLSNSDLSEEDLHEALLSNANLSEADLSKADVRGGNLREAVLNAATLCEASFCWANLRDAVLIKANLRDVDLRGADLRGAVLRGALLSDALINGAVLNGVNLSGANLNRANLSGADLSQANLSTADLRGVDLRGAILNFIKCKGALVSYTTFGDVDLSQINDLETIVHDGPSYIDIQTIYRSGGNIPEAFLRGAGVPDNFITYMKSLTAVAFKFYSCFICHSNKDAEFVERLKEDLRRNGVSCWYAPEDLTIGEPLLLGIDRGIRLHDKVLLVLSRHSVDSGWVQHEVSSALAKEQGKAPWVLFPIRLDNTVMETDVPWTNMIRESRHIGDFTRWEDQNSYKKAFDRLLRDLKGKQPA